ncbi:heme-binding protein [Mycolicibacterium mengxianglii]|uniref:heme-binding protein n=1 Tax=Mycolicibacterium mengxianglii TaxID=2736649 RepID=UPI0018D17A57|nr:heme-binding protein [Mycolicibacterium mengxianglii]
MLLTARSAVAGVLGAGAVTGAILFAAAPAIAEPPPNCSAADLASVASGVSASTSAYLFSHPPVNDFFTSLHGLTPDEIKPKVDEYFNANPQVKSELLGIRKPLQDVRLRCGDTNGDGQVDIL